MPYTPVRLGTEQETLPLKSIQELKPVLMSAKEVVVLDIETTGLSPAKHAEIIEIGAVKVNIDTKKIVDIFSQLIKPSEAFTIPEHITELTTISWEDLQDMPYIEDVLPAFYRFLGDCPIVAHNALFDWHRFLVHYFRNVGLHATNEAICSMRLAKEVLPGRGQTGYNLASLCGYYGSVIVGHHRACVDAKWTASLFLKLLEQYRNSNTLNSSMNLSSDLLPLPSTIPIENFDGMQIRSIGYYEGQSKRHGPKIYVRTNLGCIAYSARRHLWTVQELWTDKNAPAQRWGKEILRRVNLQNASDLVQYALQSA